MELNIPVFYGQPEQANDFLNSNREELEQQKQTLYQDLDAFNEIKRLKQWLNSLKISKAKETRLCIDDLFYF
jgi:hypothetical protein